MPEHDSPKIEDAPEASPKPPKFKPSAPVLKAPSFNVSAPRLPSPKKPLIRSPSLTQRTKADKLEPAANSDIEHTITPPHSVKQQRWSSDDNASELLGSILDDIREDAEEERRRVDAELAWRETQAAEAKARAEAERRARGEQRLAEERRRLEELALRRQALAKKIDAEQRGPGAAALMQTQQPAPSATPAPAPATEETIEALQARLRQQEAHLQHLARVAAQRPAVNPALYDDVAEWKPRRTGPMLFLALLVALVGGAAWYYLQPPTQQVDAASPLTMQGSYQRIELGITTIATPALEVRSNRARLKSAKKPAAKTKPKARYRRPASPLSRKPRKNSRRRRRSTRKPAANKGLVF